jgi:hypothetical protein
MDTRISQAVASVPEWRRSTEAQSANDSSDLVHRVAVAEGLLDAAKTTLQERALQVAVLSDTIHVLQSSFEDGLAMDSGDPCDCGLRGTGWNDGADMDSANDAEMKGDEHDGGGCRRQVAALSRRVVQLTAQVAAMAKGCVATAGFKWSDTVPHGASPGDSHSRRIRDDGCYDDDSHTTGHEQHATRRRSIDGSDGVDGGRIRRREELTHSREEIHQPLSSTHHEFRVKDSPAGGEAADTASLTKCRERLLRAAIALRRRTKERDEAVSALAKLKVCDMFASSVRAASG